MHYVYLLQSLAHPDQRYIGLTANLDQRLTAHNAGLSPHTAKYRPWQIAGYLAFADANKAVAFEQYLKSGSGRAFAAKRLWPEA